MDRPEGRTPADNRQLAASLAQRNILIRDTVRYAQHLVAADFSHLLMIGRAIINMPGINALFDAADTVHQARRTWLDPWPRQLLVARIRFQSAFRHRFQEGRREWLETTNIRYFPRLCRIGNIAVGEQHDRGHILYRNPHRLDCAFKGIAGRARCNDRHRRIAVAAIDSLIEIRLLGLGRQSGRRSAALRIDNDQRKFGHDRQSHRLAFQRNAGTGG